jgi:nicotinamide-nucleotide amidase
MELVALCKARGVTVATAESCTGGLIAAAITEVPGSSAVFTHGFVTYSNAAKSEMLGVPAGLITSVGAVSEAVASRMAAGARQRAGATLAVSVTGIAGPDGGTPQKPVGTVCFGLASPSGVTTYTKRFMGNRHEVREESVVFALELLSKAVAFLKKSSAKNF